MKRVMLEIAYDGTNYCGWQVQPNGITVQEVINQKLSELLKEPIETIGASRTDAGVHALGNVAVFDTSARMPGEKITYLPLDVEKMRKAGEYLLGEHDFKSFCGAGAQVKTTVRTIYDFQIKKEDDEICMRITGSGFLYNMVRILAGTLIEVGSGARKPEDMLEIIEAKDRKKAGATAPARGLTLIKIQYEE